MKKQLPAGLIAAISMIAAPASAHVGLGDTSDFHAGLLHPFSGMDHLLAMVAVGLWAGYRGGGAKWVWPLAFVGSMLLGGAAGMAGMAMPMAEQGIVASVLALGLALALGFRAPIVPGALMIAVAGLCHGYAHGLEAPASGGGLLYAMGFVVATSILHTTGVVAILVAGRSFGSWPTRAAGLAILAGGAFLTLQGA